MSLSTKMNTERKQLDCGVLYSFSSKLSKQKYLVFFGNKHSTLEKLKQQFPDLNFAVLRQTHSDILLESITQDSFSPLSREGDAHWTNETNVALCVRTADCLPILAFDENRQCILAIHAGWKGVANRILVKSLDELIARNKLSQASTSLFIGPHILFNSFEVSNDVAQQLRNAIPTAQHSTQFFKKLDNEKELVDLLSICKAQAKEEGLPEEAFFFELADTKTNNEFSSFRREKDLAGRQISFVARLD